MFFQYLIPFLRKYMSFRQKRVQYPIDTLSNMPFCLPFYLLLSIFLLIVNVILCYSIITFKTIVKGF